MNALILSYKCLSLESFPKDKVSSMLLGDVSMLLGDVF